MSFRSIASRIKNVGKWFKDMSYKDVSLGYKVIQLDSHLKNLDTDAKKRIYKREYVVDKSPIAIKIYNRKDKVLTVNQIRDIFDKLGFNVDATFGELFDADVMLVYNLGGYVVPMYRSIAKLMIKIFPKYKDVILTKMSPGLRRLHCRLYNEEDGSWYLISHIDNSNWMNILNPIELVKSHLTKGAGDYVLGNEIMKRTFEKFVPKFNDRENFYVDIGEIYNSFKRKV